MMNFVYKHALAKMYGVSERTLYNRINRDINLGRALYESGWGASRKVSPKQLRLIFEIFGTPKEFKNKGLAEIKAYKMSELARLYGLDRRTLVKTLKATIDEEQTKNIFGERYKTDWSEINYSKRFMDVPSVKVIFEVLGTPYVEKEEE